MSIEEPLFQPHTPLNYAFQKWDERNHVFEAIDETTYALSIPSKDQVHIGTISNPKPHTLAKKKPKPKPKPKPNPTPANTNSSLTLVPLLPPILTQGDIGCCVANAFAFCISYQTAHYVNPSRLFHYANSRILDNTPIDQDDGTTIQTACSALLRYGACQETEWPYSTSQFSTMPPLTAYQASKKFKSFTYSYIQQDSTSIKACLNTYKVPIIFGFLIYNSFLSNTVTQTGQVPVPNTKTETLQGGHCISIVGYDDTTQQFICSNSWGTGWGAGGYCYIPYTYLMNPQLASDFCFTQFQY